MKPTLKYKIIVIALLSVTLPFILVTDIFPLMRFGMFAEPVKRAVQTESFILTYLTSEGKEKIFHPEKIGIESHFFFYLTRNYYYRGEAEQLFEKVGKAPGLDNINIKEWRLKKITTNIDSLVQTDTIIVAKKLHEE